MKTVSIFLMAALLSACGSASFGTDPGVASPSSSPVPNSPTPMLTATADATTTPPPTPRPLLVADEIAEVITTDLVVRSLPEISHRSSIDPIRLDEGEGVLLFVLDGPVSADGYDWYFVAPFMGTLSDIAVTRPGIGWVAAGKGADDWITPWAGACPEPTVDALRLVPSTIAIACFGDRELILEGDLGACTYVVPGTIEPAWLATQYCELHGEERGYELIAPFTFHLEPDDFEIREGPRLPVRVTGSFDHPAAQSCEHHPLPGDEALIPELVVLGCRSAFVATEIEER